MHASLTQALQGSGALESFVKEIGNVGGERATFELRAGPFVGRELTVVDFTGREEISACFSFEVRFLTSLPAPLVEETLFGQPAGLCMAVSNDAPRVVQGIVSALEPQGTVTADDLTLYRARIVPRLWLLKKTTHSRIFQDRTPDAIIKSILDANQIPCAFKLSKALDPREYCVQYEETDYDFITRLAADEGLFFYFQHPSGKLDALTSAGFTEVVVFSDNNAYPALGLEGLAASALHDVAGEAEDELAELGAAASVDVSVDLGGGPCLKFRDPQGVTPSEEYVYDFSLRRKIEPKSVLLKDFDFTRPLLDVSAKASMKKGKASARIGLGMGSGITAALDLGLDAARPPVGYDPKSFQIYDHDGSQDPKVDEDDAKKYLEQLRSRAQVGRGSSWCRRLVPGYRFTLTEHSVEELNRQYVCTRIDHQGHTPELHRGEVDAGGGEGDSKRPIVYQNDFHCVPVEVTYRPPRPPRNLTQVMETAIVTGPEGEEIYVDSRGRVKVQFHWDRGKRNERSSCWLRVAQAWAGASFGAQFIPRVGMEVVVSFLAGDMDRPVILGCLYNGLNPPSHPLPSEKTRSGIRTQTSPGPDGYNEIAFEDQKGKEFLSIRAQRDLREEAGNDHELIVGTGALGSDHPIGDQTVAIGRDQRVRVGNDQTTTVGGRKREVVDGNRSSLVKGADRLRVVKDSSLTVDGSRYENVAEAHHLEVGAGAVMRVGEDLRVEVLGDEEISVHGRQSISVSGDIAVAAGDDFATSVGRSISFDAVDSIRLVCGESVIEMRPDEIVITSPKITGAVTDTLLLAAKDSSFTLLKEKAVLATKTEAKITSKAIKVFGEQSGVDISKDATKVFGKDTSIAGTSSVKLKGKQANIDLEADAAIKGATVKLDGDGGIKMNCGGSDADASGQSEDSKPDKLDTSWIEIELDEEVAKNGDPKNKVKAPVPRARYIVAAGGKHYYGTLDGSGRARIPIRPGSATVTFPDFDGDAVKSG